MEEERAVETPVRMFRRTDGTRAEMVDVSEQVTGWTGHLFRPVRIWPAVYPKGLAWTCLKADWTEGGG